MWGLLGENFIRRRLTSRRCNVTFHFGAGTFTWARLFFAAPVLRFNARNLLLMKNFVFNGGRVRRRMSGADKN